MKEKTIINFKEGKNIAQIINGSDVSLETKDYVFGQLIDKLDNSKKMGLSLQKINKSKNFNGYPFILSNKDSKLVINFEDNKNEYYETFNNIYLEQKIKKENKVKNVKVFTTKVVATILVTTMLGALAYGTIEAYDAERKIQAEKSSEYVQKLNEERMKNGELPFSNDVSSGMRR